MHQCEVKINHLCNWFHKDIKKNLTCATYESMKSIKSKFALLIALYASLIILCTDCRAISSKLFNHSSTLPIAITYLSSFTFSPSLDSMAMILL